MPCNSKDSLILWICRNCCGVSPSEAWEPAGLGRAIRAKSIEHELHWIQSEKHGDWELVWGTEERGLRQSDNHCCVSWILCYDFVCGSVSAPLSFTCCSLLHCPKSLHKVSEGQTQTNVMVSPVLLVQASLSSYNDCWHCDLEVLLFEEAFFGSRGGWGKQRVRPRGYGWSPFWSD